MLGAATTPALTVGNIEVDAEVGRQAPTAIDLLRLTATPAAWARWWWCTGK
jgi:hypothetical protein